MDFQAHFKIDWGRQGTVLLCYIIIILGYYGIIANTMMFDEYGNWISFVDMDRTILFWTFKIFIPSFFNPIIHVLILIILMVLIIFFSLKEWHSSLMLSILIPVLITFILLSFTFQVLALCLLFFVCFVLTYKEDIPHYGIRASIWLVPTIIVEGFIFYLSMFEFSLEPLILQFGSREGYVNLLILSLTVLSGSLSGMKIKKKSVRKKEKFELNEIN